MFTNKSAMSSLTKVVSLLGTWMFIRFEIESYKVEREVKCECESEMTRTSVPQKKNECLHLAIQFMNGT